MLLKNREAKKIFFTKATKQAIVETIKMDKIKEKTSMNDATKNQFVSIRLLSQEEKTINVLTKKEYV